MNLSSGKSDSKEEYQTLDLYVLIEGPELSGNSDLALTMKGVIVAMTFYGDKGGYTLTLTKHNLWGSTVC
jgi:hypothetical protein